MILAVLFYGVLLQGIEETHFLSDRTFACRSCPRLWKRVSNETMDIMNITEFADRNIDELSGGQRQRVWIAMALAQQTDILFLDEPTTYLDITYQVEILDLLTDLNRKRGTTIVMVLHDINLSARYADHIFALHKGKLVVEGEPSKVITSILIEDIFGLHCTVIKDPISGSPSVIRIGRYHNKLRIYS